MTIVNWIELAVFVLVLASGIIGKVITRGKVNDLDGAKGVVKRREIQGKIMEE